MKIQGIRKGSLDFCICKEGKDIKRAEIILEEERNRRKSPLPEIGGALHGAMTEGTFAVLEATRGVVGVGRGSCSDDGADRDVLLDMQGVGGKTLHMEGKAVELSGHIVSFPMEKRGTSSFNRQIHLRGTKLSGDISCATNPVGAKQQLRKEALNSVKRAETLARDAKNKAKAVSRNILMVVKLVAKSIMALFTALFANISTVLITIVISVVVVVSLLSALLPSWLREEHRISRDHTVDYYVNEVTLEEYITEKTNQWREMILLENTEDAWYVIWLGAGRTEFEPDWDGCLAEFDEWLDGKYIPGEMIEDEDIQVLDGLLAKYSDFVVTIEYFDFYEFDASSCDGVFDIRENFAKEIVGSREWYDDLDYMAAFWEVEKDGERVMRAPAVEVWYKKSIYK